MKGFSITIIVFLLIGLMVLIAAPAISLAEGPMIELDVRSWYTDLEFNSRRSTATSDGSELDYKKDLDIHDKTMLDWRLTWYANSDHTLNLSFISTSLEGNAILTKNVTHEGVLFAQGSFVHTDIDLSLMELAWKWWFYNEKYIKVGTLVEVKGIMLDVELLRSAGTVKGQEELYTVIPLFGIAVSSSPFDFIELFGEASGIYVDQKNVGHAYDAEAGLRVYPFKNVSLGGGYRIIRINAEDAPDYADFEIKGPFISAGVRF